MPGDPIEALLAGGLGYLIGRSQFAGWEDVKKNYEQRMGHLSYFKVTKPVGLFQEVGELRTVFSQQVAAYLFGLPDASVAMSMKSLEVGLKRAKAKAEGKLDPKENLASLIDWAEKHLGSKKDIAHGFRILRNLLHESTLIKEQDALEAVVHVTEVLNLLYPFETAQMDWVCPQCGANSRFLLQKGALCLGNAITLACGTCKQSSPFVVL